MKGDSEKGPILHNGYCSRSVSDCLACVFGAHPPDATLMIRNVSPSSGASVKGTGLPSINTMCASGYRPSVPRIPHTSRPSLNSLSIASPFSSIITLKQTTPRSMEARCPLNYFKHNEICVLIGGASALVPKPRNT